MALFAIPSAYCSPSRQRSRLFQLKLPLLHLDLETSLAHQLGGRLQFTSDNGCRIEVDLKRL